MIISIGDTLGFAGMKGVFKLATALWKEGVSRHRLCKKTICTDQKGPYVSKPKLRAGGCLHTRSHTSSAGRTGPETTLLDSPAQCGFFSFFFPTKTAVFLTYLPSTKTHTHTRTHTYTHVTCSISTLIRICEQYNLSLVCKNTVISSFLHSLFPLC